MIRKHSNITESPFLIKKQYVVVAAVWVLSVNTQVCPYPSWNKMERTCNNFYVVLRKNEEDRVIIAVMKQNEQSNLGEKRDYFVYASTL